MCLCVDVSGIGECGKLIYQGKMIARGRSKKYMINRDEAKRTVSGCDALNAEMM